MRRTSRSAFESISGAEILFHGIAIAPGKPTILARKDRCALLGLPGNPAAAVVVFTLFPALQRILNTPTQTERKVAAQWFQRFTDRLPLFTYRWRYVLVSGALLLSAVGAVSVFGLPGILAPMPLETDSLEYIDHDTRLYRVTRALERVIAGLSVTEVWLRGQPGSVTDPEVLAGLDRFSRSLESDPRIGSVMGPSTLLRMFRYGRK